jgi:PPK2 family polyphosphate:nucleotide phosphotransferase
MATPLPDLDHLRVPPGKPLTLADRDPDSKRGLPDGKSERVTLLAKLGERLDVLQDVLAAEAKHKVLLVLQGMDTSGKDGTVRSVFGTVDPLGVRVAAFKVPSEAERARDYLWRVHAQVPAAGEIVIFNRSHYEDVLVTRVHGWVDARECTRRYAQINDFERMLTETGTTIVKCMLHISKDEQRKRLEDRRTDPVKHFKFSLGDLEERKLWDSYMTAYEQALAATSSEHAPWHVIPANSNSTRNACVAALLVPAIERLKPAYPEPTTDLSKIVIV